MVDSLMIKLLKLPNAHSGLSMIKKSVVKTTLFIIGTGFELVSKWAPDMKDEIRDWEEGRKCSLGVLPNGPSITIEKSEGRIRFPALSAKPADVTFLFKNIDAAFMVFTTRMSPHVAVAECRILVDGNNTFAVELNRALGIVETYLFPRFVQKLIFKRVPEPDARGLRTKIRILAQMPAAMGKKLIAS